jgi:hypothetical protein
MPPPALVLLCASSSQPRAHRTMPDAGRPPDGDHRAWLVPQVFLSRSAERWAARPPLSKQF